MIKVHNLSVAATRRLPWSLSALFSKHHLEKYLIDSYHRINLDHPYDVLHLQNSWWMVKISFFFRSLIVNLMNPLTMIKNLMMSLVSPWSMWSSVRSETLHIKRQSRFALDWKGGLLDLQRMTSQQVSDYLSDPNEIERQQNPGRRHRNWDTVQCRYLHIDKRQAVESLKRIEKSEFPKINLKYTNVRVGRRSEINNNISLDPTNKSQMNFKHQKSLEPNPQKKLLLYIHGNVTIVSYDTYESYDY